MCSHAMDVDWDGEREIMIGTYGRQVLIYKQGKRGSGSKYIQGVDHLHKRQMQWQEHKNIMCFGDDNLHIQSIASPIWISTVMGWTS